MTEASKRDRMRQIAEERIRIQALRNGARAHLDDAWYGRRVEEAEGRRDAAVQDLERLAARRAAAQNDLAALDRAEARIEAEVRKIDVQPKVDKMAVLKQRIAELEAQLAEEAD